MNNQVKKPQKNKILYKCIAFFFIFILMANSLFAQETTLDGANSHFSNNGYEVVKYSPLKNITIALRSLGTFGLILFLIFSVIVYILVYIFFKKTKCVIIWSWWDLICIVISSFIFIFFLFDFENKIKNDTAINIIYFIVTITTFVFSVISNIKYSLTKWPFYAIISILTKFVLLIVIPLIVVLAIIFWLFAISGKKDKRYRDGTLNNERTYKVNLFVSIFTAIYTFLIINLIKFDKKIKDE